MIEGFDEIVLAWEKHELFYKELYEKKKGNPAEYRRFLSQLNVEDLREEGLVVPDLYDTFEIYGETTPIFDLNTDIAVWKHSRYTPAYLHAHRYFEIVCVVSGHARHRVSGETVMELQPGDICILPDGVCHSLEVISDDGIVINVMLRKVPFSILFLIFYLRTICCPVFFRMHCWSTRRTIICSSVPEMRKTIRLSAVSRQCS